MNTGTILAIVVLLAYLGFEAVAFYKVSHRMEPAYIHNLLVETKAAVDICNTDVSALHERFERTLSRATNTLKKNLAENIADANSQDIENQIIEHISQAQGRARQSLATTGCESQQMKDYAAKYRIYAKKSR